MGLITWLVLGLIAGFIASKVVHHHGQGIVIDLVLGVVGAFVGGLIFQLIGGRGVTGFNVWSLLVAVAGAIVVLLLWNAITGRRTTVVTR
jgi:uncharacterized membrane protein YeaQ/YmgE (transglycosylase-associated protein family)